MHIAASTPAATGTLAYEGLHRTWVVNQDETAFDTTTAGMRLYAGPVVGSPTGYGSLGDAIRSAQFLTHWSDGPGDNESDAILVFRHDQRYVLREARERVAGEDGGYAGVRARPVDFEYLEDWRSHAAVQPSYEHADLRALVDGEHVQRFLPGAVEPGTRP